MAVLAAVANLDVFVELTNIGTLFAFVLVCAGVMILRYSDPGPPRPFRTPFVPFVPLAGIAICVYLMKNLPLATWIRFGVWLADRPRPLLLLRLPPQPIRLARSRRRRLRSPPPR